MKKLRLSDIEVDEKKVIVRVDFNVPLDSEGHITDDTRIIAALPTIQYLLNHNASVILMSHLGRPKGKRNPELSLAPCAKRLSELLEKPVTMATDCVGPKVKKLAEQLKPGEVILLENLRFHKAEEHPEEDPSFAKNLADLAEIYVNDAFGSAHRAHSSTVSIAHYFPDRSAAGLLMEKELTFLGQTVLAPKRPFYAIIGGAKISSKLGVLKALLQKADKILIGGAMAYTFFKAQGIPIGGSLHEDDLLDAAKEILHTAKLSSVKLLLPIDNLLADKLNHKAHTKVLSTSNGIPQGWQGVDIGPETISYYKSELAGAGTIFWNGPLGIFEIPEFSEGTREIAETIAAQKAITIIGGGDSIAAVNTVGVKDSISHISTGGGASLEFIEFGSLPGIEALSNAPAKMSSAAKR